MAIAPLLSRRFLLKSTGLALVASSVVPAFLQRAVAQTAGPRRKVLVSLFLRGGMDGLSVVAPTGDPDYFRLRPSLALKPGGGALPLSDLFSLHPALAPLLPLWQSQRLAFIHASGQEKASRSHFDAQDFMEAGVPGQRASDGWMNRALQHAPPLTGDSAFRAVALQPRLPRALAGAAPSLSVNAVADFQLRLGGGAGAGLDGRAAKSFASLYSGAVDEALRHSGDEAFGALRQAADARIAELPPANGAVYGRSPLARRLQDIARLIRADVGLEVAATEIGGWDTHVTEGAEAGQLANHLQDLGAALAAFAQDLGPRLDDVLLVAMTEFGRTAQENGTRGTDHGTGSVMLVLGGEAKGGRVLGRWPGLRADQLSEGRDLAVTTDYRTVLAEALTRHLGVADPSTVFPGLRPAEKVGLFG